MIVKRSRGGGAVPPIARSLSAVIEAKLSAIMSPVDPVLCAQRYFTPRPKIGLQAREWRVGKINPAPNLAGVLAVCDEHQTEDIDKFKHLGSMFVANGQDTEEIRSRVNLARSPFFRLQPCLWSRCEVSLRTKDRVYQT